jgi:putative chitinase
MPKIVLINRPQFYQKLRNSSLVSLKPISQSQVEGIEVIFNEWDTRSNLTDVRWLAYMLATVYHECAGTMQPIEEFGKGKTRTYGKKIKMNGRPYSTPNKIYYGRGLVQLTWYENYSLMGRLLGIDLLNHPELALDPTIAIKIMIEGMTLGSSLRGDFTGKSLEIYFNKTTDDPKTARKIINGLDKAALIAGYHKQFLACLK